MGVLTKMIPKKTSSARPRYQTVDVELLKLADYQRTLIRKKIDNYVQHYDPMIFGTILASYRDGEYWVVDGQHRVEVAKRLGIKTVWCQIIEGLTYEQEAEEFYKINTHRTPLNSNQKFHALVEAFDSSAVEIVKILNQNNMTYSKRGQEFTNNCITAVGTIQNIYKKSGAKQLDEVLSIVQEAWNGDYTSLRAEILKGVNTFISNYTYIRRDLVAVLESNEPLDIITQARALVPTKRVGRSDGTCFHIARLIRDMYEEYSIKTGGMMCGRKVARDKVYA